MATVSRGLGRCEPKDWKHVSKYSLTASTFPDKPTPVILGIPWFASFDKPVLKDGKYWIGLDPKNLGRFRGGHCVCSPADPKKDARSWYAFYDQGNEGACVGFGASRAMSLLNRKMYNAWWLWDEAKKVDMWADTNPGDSEGTSVSAAIDVLRVQGHVPARSKKKVAQVDEGVLVNRWAQNVRDVHGCLQNKEYDELGAVGIFNSWGKDYPHLVYMPDETLNVCFDDWAEATVFTDR